MNPALLELKYGSSICDEFLVAASEDACDEILMLRRQGELESWWQGADAEAQSG